MIRMVLFLILAPIVAHAEPVAIRSGEHADFSRLVLSIDPESQWSIVSTDEGYQLNLMGATDGFSTNAVFERIPRTRLIELTQLDSGSLFLNVDCDCYLDSFLWQPDQLVIDVIDGPAPTEINDQSPLEILLEPVEASLSTALPDLLELRNSGMLQVQDELPTEFRQETQSPEVTATEVALVEGLARAASQGFLNPAISVEPDIEEPLGGMQLEEPEDLPGPSVTLGHPGIGISSAMDREFARLDDAMSAIVEQQCLPSDLFEINSWADETGLHEQVALLAEGLAGEFGEEPREAQDDLARLYLHFGFGAEARAVLSVDIAQSQTRQILTELAGIIDDYPGSYDLVASQAGCSNPAALWAFYVDPISLEEGSRNHILQQFFAMPQPLRGQMAPRIARRFVSIGDLDAASKLLQASESQDAKITHDVRSTRALIAEENDEPLHAIEVLKQEADDNARTTPESLIRLVELALSQNQVPEWSDISLISSMRQEYRGAPIVADLEVAEAKGLIAFDLYDDALGLLSDRDDADASLVINNAYLQMIQATDPTQFLKFAFDRIPASLELETENKVAEKLIEIGFPERALIVMSANFDDEATTDRRLLRARASIEIGNFSEAITEVEELTGTEVNNLRAQAYTSLGEYRLALEALGPNSRSDSEEILQFRAGAWDRLSFEEDETLSAFADAALTPVVEEPNETLMQRRAILSQSQNSRQAVEGLLQRFDTSIIE